jgi:Na+/melibiose symporter-like transporter
VYIELFERDNFKRLATASIVFIAQQATGATAFAYFGPSYFKLLVGGGSKDLLLTAIFGAVKVVACGFFVLFLFDRIGRRKVLIGGAAFMAACQITTAAVVKNRPAPGEGKVTSSGIATVALIYLFVIAYNLSWGPLQNLPNSDPRNRHSGRRLLSVAFQFRLFHHNTVYDYEPWMGHVPSVGFIRCRHCNCCVPLFERNERALP